jgi:hypothetical protein
MSKGDTIAGLESVAAAAALTIRPAAGIDYIVHNIYHEAEVELKVVEGSDKLLFDSAATKGSWSGDFFHLTRSHYLEVKNTNAGAKLVSYDGIVSRYITEGYLWTIRTSAADNNWRSVTYGNGLFVAVANTGTGNRVMTSPDGANWTIRTSAEDNDWTSVTYGNGLFVAVAYSGTGNRVMTSPDGANWTIRTSAADNDWRGVTYGNGLFVAVANTGTGNRVMTSGQLSF